MFAPHLSCFLSAVGIAPCLGTRWKVGSLPAALAPHPRRERKRGLRPADGRVKAQFEGVSALSGYPFATFSHRARHFFSMAPTETFVAFSPDSEAEFFF